jgi:hypothetical protein
MAGGPSGRPIGVSGVLDNILHRSPLWLLGTAVPPVFLEDAIFIGFLVPGETAAVLAGVGASLVFCYIEDWSVRVGSHSNPPLGRDSEPPLLKVNSRQRTS